MRIDDVHVQTSSGPMPVYTASPDTGARKAVIVLPEVFGVNEHVKDVTRRFADAGYRAVAPDVYHRSGAKAVDDYTDNAGVMALLAGFTDDGVLDDVDAALRLLGDDGVGASAIGVVGFSLGGRSAFLAATARELGAAVSFYAGGVVTATVLPAPTLIDGAGELRTPWLGLFGDQDPIIPVDDVEKLRSAVEGAPVPTEIVRYADAGHGFLCDARGDFHKPASENAWPRTLAWLEAHLR